MYCEEKIEFINGDDIKITFTVYKNEQLVSLDGATIKFLMSYYCSEDLLVEKTGIKTNNLGEFIVTLVPNDTKGFIGTFDYQIEITDITGKINTTNSRQINIMKKIN